MNKKDCIVVCICDARIIPGEKQKSLEDGFRKLNIDVFELHDLCAFALNEKDFLNSLKTDYNRKFIVACYPRAIENIFRQNNIDPGDFEVINFREEAAGEIIEIIEEKLDKQPADFGYRVMKSSLEVPAWYPVIDQSRCTLCGQCARFCLFGVYRYTKKSLEVVNPLACKNNCPACGRTCPASAIIFSRLPENDVISGAEPVKNQETATATREEGLFIRLNERNSNRKNIFRQDLMLLAEEERRKALDELKTDRGKKQ